MNNFPVMWITSIVVANAKNKAPARAISNAKQANEIQIGRPRKWTMTEVG